MGELRARCLHGMGGKIRGTYKEKKTTTSTTLAVCRFHLDGARHLEETEIRQAKMLVMVIQAAVAIARSHKPKASI